MGKLIDFLSGTQILEEVESLVNGKITVIRSLAFGTYIQVGGLTQSGGIIHNVWKKPLNKIKNSKLQIQKCLVLGLGGGTVVKILEENWPKAKIVGVDIDRAMVDLGKRYLGLKEDNIVIDDAYDYLTKNLELKTESFDLILIDTYVGDEFPAKFESETFVNLVKKNLTEKGVAVFNRLYYGEKRPRAVKFSKTLEKIFTKVDVVYPQANVMLVCSR